MKNDNEEPEDLFDDEEYTGHLDWLDVILLLVIILGLAFGWPFGK